MRSGSALLVVAGERSPATPCSRGDIDAPAHLELRASATATATTSCRGRGTACRGPRRRRGRSGTRRPPRTWRWCWNLHVLGQAVDLHPLDRLLPLPVLLQHADALELVVLGRELRVAAHAELDRRNARGARAIGAGVAVLAVDLVLARVVLVAERDRLVRARARPGPSAASCEWHAARVGHGLSNSARDLDREVGILRLAAPCSSLRLAHAVRARAPPSASASRAGGPERAAASKSAALGGAQPRRTARWGRVPESHLITRARVRPISIAGDTLAPGRATEGRPDAARRALPLRGDGGSLDDSRSRRQASLYTELARAVPRRAARRAVACGQPIASSVRCALHPQVSASPGGRVGAIAASTPGRRGSLRSPVARQARSAIHHGRSLDHRRRAHAARPGQEGHRRALRRSIRRSCSRSA